METNNRFIIIRGPSGSGKSTVAKELFKAARERTALIEQDYYRFIFNPSGGGGKPNSPAIHEMIEHNCMVALRAGYDVILEGILSVKSYEDILDRLITAHKGSSYMFYFDVSFEETARRHQTRRQKHEFSVEDMREWYDTAHRSHHSLEQLIPESYSVADAVALITETIAEGDG